MKYLKSFNENLSNEILIQIGDYIITQNDIDTKYKKSIINHYGEFTEETINKTLYHLRDLEGLYESGGSIYRAIWLEDIKDFNKEKFGPHWVLYPDDINTIVYLFSGYPEYKGSTYVITAYAPPKTISAPYDYFANIEENEVLIEDTSKIEFIKIQTINDFRKEKCWGYSRL